MALGVDISMGTTVSRWRVAGTVHVRYGLKAIAAGTCLGFERARRMVL